MKRDHLWLNPYAQLLRDKHIVGLGCGTGIDSTALSQWAKSPLAFEAGAFDGVVASLCLH